MGSVLVCFAITFLNVFYQFKHTMLKKSYNLVFRMVQEISISLIVAIIGLFYFDEDTGGMMTRALKLKFTSGVLILICINIFLEIISGVITFAIMMINKVKNMRKNIVTYEKEIDKIEPKHKDVKIKVKIQQINIDTEISEKESLFSQSSERIILSKPKKKVVDTVIDLTAPLHILSNKKKGFMKITKSSRSIKNSLSNKGISMKLKNKKSSNRKIQLPHYNGRTSLRVKLDRLHGKESIGILEPDRKP